MGMLIDGTWHEKENKNDTEDGEFNRNESSFRGWITPDGKDSPNGTPGFPAAADRYHLYVSLACPWAHRSLIFRRLKDLEQLIGLTVVEPLMLENGWELGESARKESPVEGIRFLHQLYTRADPQYTGRVTVPVMWDKQEQTIVNNESAEIIRMLNRSFDEITGNRDDYCPQELLGEIDRVNERVYAGINNGVYKVGFAARQEAYEKAFDRLFADLDWLEERLERQRYLVGRQLTEADIRLFTTLVRFDAVYYGHFKANLKRIEDYPNLSNYLRDLFQTTGVGETVDFDQIKTHYYGSHKDINPNGIIPKGPELDYSRPHDRDREY